MKRALLSLTALFFCLAAKSLADEFPSGEIIQKVECKSAPFSYALYLPSSYTHSKKWPIIYCFDPAARGSLPLERFKEAAEKYGYLLVGSNDSRNGPDTPLGQIVRALWEDTHLRLSIDENQICAAGFSGGARVASGVAYSAEGRIQGVIGCGAGFNSHITPSGTFPFVFFGTIGTEDFNYYELRELDSSLAASGITHRVETFEGGHDWASSALCLRAVEWMQLQAIKSGRRARDEAFIEGLFAERARSLEASVDIYQAYVMSEQIAQDFKGLRDVSRFEKRAAELKDAKEVRQAIKLDRDQITEQKRRAAQLLSMRARLRSPQEFVAAPDLSVSSGGLENRQFGAATGSSADAADERRLLVMDLRRAIADLKNKSDAKENTPERALARRILNQYTAHSYELTMLLLQTRKYELAAQNLEVEAEIRPDNSRLFYQLACAHSQAGNKKKAIDALKKAVQKGFKNIEELKSSPALDQIRQEAGFQKIVEGIKKD
jgi:tetratricopeptide (TPR) repeat protein